MSGVVPAGFGLRMWDLSGAGSERRAISPSGPPSYVLQASTLVHLTCSHREHALISFFPVSVPRFFEASFESGVHVFLPELGANVWYRVTGSKSRFQCFLLKLHLELAII